ncbi:MAG: hypothetical protein DRO89_02290 [Candidatus Altiarchaeales archaeon]|nr:MAG: hypothetical protein DRO89_02290 [Candidatus Altiarchaeales archaeon]
MKRDVNFVFFGLLILLLIAMVGIMLYSDYTYHKVNAQYLKFKEMFEQAQNELNRSREEIKAKDEELQEKEQALIDIINELNLSKQRISSLSDYYTTVKSEKENLEMDLSRIERERDQWKSDYLAAKKDLGVCEKNYDLKKKEVELLESDIAAYRDYATKLSLNIDIAMEEAEDLMNALDIVDCTNASVCEDEIENITEMLQDLQSTLLLINDNIDHLPK